MGDVNLEIKLSNLDERVIKIEESGGGSGGDGYITSVSNDFNVINKKLSLSNDVTTKLPKSVPTTSDAGKVAKVQSDGTVDWEMPSASITEPTELEKGIIGGDEWVSGGSYTIGESVVIDENKLYLLVGDGGNTTKPSTDATHSIWKEISISELNKKLSKSTLHSVPTTLLNIAIRYSKWGKLVVVNIDNLFTSNYTTDTIVGTGFPKPLSPVLSPIYNASKGALLLTRISTNGELSFVDNASQNDIITGTFSYIYK